MATRRSGGTGPVSGNMGLKVDSLRTFRIRPHNDGTPPASRHRGGSFHGIPIKSIQPEESRRDRPQYATMTQRGRRRQISVSTRDLLEAISCQSVCVGNSIPVCELWEPVVAAFAWAQDGLAQRPDAIWQGYFANVRFGIVTYQLFPNNFFCFLPDGAWIEFGLIFLHCFVPRLAPDSLTALFVTSPYSIELGRWTPVSRFCLDRLGFVILLLELLDSGTYV